MRLSAQEVLEAGTATRKVRVDFAKTEKIEQISLDGMVEIRKLDVAPETAYNRGTA